jgi:hypothetical protein
MTAPHGAPIGRLVVDSSYPKWALLTTRVRPWVEINGQLTIANWGQWPIDLPASDYHVRVTTKSEGNSAAAQIPVRIHPGQQVTVYYRAPTFLFLAGAIGFQPQPTRGMVAFIVYTTVVVVLLLVILFA